MADKVITGLNKVTDVNYGDNLVIAQSAAQAKKVEVADFLTDTDSSYAIQSGIHCFDHNLKVSGDFSVTGSTTLGDECNDHLTVNASTTFNCNVSGNDFSGDYAHFKSGLFGNITITGGSGLFSGLTVLGDTTLGDNCDDELIVNAKTTFNCNVSGKDFSGNFAYFNSGHFPSGIEVDAPTSEGACDVSSQNRENSAVWPSSDRAYNIGAYSQAFDHGYAVQWNDLSDRNTKKEIQDTNLGLNFITGLKPRSFKFKDHTTSRGDLIEHKRTRHGLVAQEVKDTLDSIGVPTSGFAGYIDSSHQYPNQEPSYWLHYSQFVSPLIKAVQELHTMVTGLQDQIDNA